MHIQLLVSFLLLVVAINLLGVRPRRPPVRAVVLLFARSEAARALLRLLALLRRRLGLCLRRGLGLGEGRGLLRVVRLHLGLARSVLGLLGHFRWIGWGCRLGLLKKEGGRDASRRCLQECGGRGCLLGL